MFSRAYGLLVRDMNFITINFFVLPLSVASTTLTASWNLFREFFILLFSSNRFLFHSLTDFTSNKFIVRFFFISAADIYY